MEEIGNLLKETRETAGINIPEVSKDLDIPEHAIENIEAGKIGAFKDVFEVKSHIKEYSKYLGLDGDKIIDDFNEYLFEYTSKIPIKEIEKTIELQIKEETVAEKDKVISPYTKNHDKVDKKYYVLVFLLIILLMFLSFWWAKSQVTLNSNTANIVSFSR